MKKYRVFKDLSTVSNTQRIHLKKKKLLNPDGSPMSWVKLAPHISKRDLSIIDAKKLVLIEMDSDKPRGMILNRLVNYLANTDKRRVCTAVEKELRKSGKLK